MRCLDRFIGEKRLAVAVISRTLKDIRIFINEEDSDDPSISISKEEFIRAVMWLRSPSNDLCTFRYFADNAACGMNEYEYILSKVKIFLDDIKIYIDEYM